MLQKKEIYDAKTDPVYAKPVIDRDEWGSREVIYGNLAEYHYLHGYFEGTNVKFSIWFPTEKNFAFRFYQHLSPFPGPDEELAAEHKVGEEDFIGFALTHGAAYVESNMGSSEVFGTEQDSSIFYKSSAAVAEYCRVKAKELYGDRKVYGYVYGGSGGGYKTMSCVENTNAFDGALPFVIGSPMSLPNCLTIGSYGRRVLRNCWDKIMDAIEPGGSGDMYAGLTEDEADALREVVSMGYPPRMISAFGDDDEGSLPVLAPAVHEMDPGYFRDFWEKDGYLGADTAGNAVRDRISIHTKVMKVGFDLDERFCNEKIDAIDGRNGTDDAWQKMLFEAKGAFIDVEEVPQGENLYLLGLDLNIVTGNAAGKKLRIKAIQGNRLIPGPSFGVSTPEEVVESLEAGDEVFLDNSDYIAIQSYHRHQVPEDRSFHAWDQFRKEDGTPAIPQRDWVIAYGFTTGGCGSVQDGHIQGKVMVMNSLMDGDFPWQADWYRNKVKEVLGERFDDNFRLYYNDNAPHGDVNEGGDMTRVVSYLGMMRQALVDLSAWVEEDRTPVPSTGYELIDNQIILDPDVKKRGGLQPKVTLLAEGEKCVRICAGEAVIFTTMVECPKGTGDFVSAEFSFEGAQTFCDQHFEITDHKAGNEDTVKTTVLRSSHTYTEPGTYFAVVRVITNRNPKDGYTRLRNLDRVRIIVEKNE